MKNPTSVLITGASSGIGAALAVAYAAPGVTLTLCGRDKARLEISAGRCRARGAEVATAQFDVTDASAAAHSVAEAAHPAPPDPVQAKIFMIMPLMMTGMMAFFPAGLVLYWFSNTLLSIAQQWRINKVIEAAG